VQVVVPDICQLDALDYPEDRPPSVVNTMLSGMAARPTPRFRGRSDLAD
jgi:hypothetical protein